MKLQTCPDLQQLKQLVEGTLNQPTEAAVEDHLSACESCRSKVEESIQSADWWQQARSSLRSSSHEMETDDSPHTLIDVLSLLGPTDDPEKIGRIAEYEVIGIIGRGGMGVVFKAFDPRLNRFVAIKTLLPHLAASGAARKRFAREAQAVAAVVDDHVMAIHCVDEWQGVPYLVMTYSRGITLQKRLSDNGPLEVREILRIGMQAAKGLAAAHAQGIVHRDIKPANIFLDQNVERVQLMDFGLARAVDDASLTRTGVLAGTPQYMSPEQARAETVDHRSDLFSLGSVMYAMCTGHAPFRAESSYSVLRLITDNEPRPIREINPDVPEWLCLLISRLMSKSLDDRFASAQEVADLLGKCLAHVQQPTSASLPASVVPHANGRRSIFYSTRKGVIAMLGTMTWIIKNRRVLWISTVVVALGVILCVALLNGLGRENRVFDGSLRPVTESSRDSRLPDQWRVELEIPDSDLARIRSHVNSDEDIDVEFVAALAPTSSFRGKLRLIDLQTKIDNLNISVASVRIHSIDGDIPERQLIPPKLLLPGAKIRARIHFENSP